MDLDRVLLYLPPKSEVESVTENCITIRTRVKTPQDWAVWLQEFTAKSHTGWIGEKVIKARRSKVNCQGQRSRGHSSRLITLT